MRGEFLLHAQIVGEEGVGFARPAHGDKLGGPLADAGKLAEMGDDVVQILTQVKESRIGANAAASQRSRRRERGAS